MQYKIYLITLKALNVVLIVTSFFHTKSPLESLKFVAVMHVLHYHCHALMQVQTDRSFNMENQSPIHCTPCVCVDNRVRAV